MSKYISFIASKCPHDKDNNCYFMTTRWMFQYIFHANGYFGICLMPINASRLCCWMFYANKCFYALLDVLIILVLLCANICLVPINNICLCANTCLCADICLCANICFNAPIYASMPQYMPQCPIYASVPQYLALCLFLIINIFLPSDD